MSKVMAAEGQPHRAGNTEVNTSSASPLLKGSAALNFRRTRCTNPDVVMSSWF